MDDKAYAEKETELENEIKPILTDEFLSTLIKAARTCGWSVDHIETVHFINWCFNVVEKKQPERDELTPFIDEFD